MLKSKYPSTIPASAGTFHCNPNDSGAADLLDDCGGRVTLLDRRADHHAAARLDGIASDDLVGGPVRPLHQTIRLHPRNDLCWRVVVENRHGVDTLERRQHFRPDELRVDRTSSSLVPAHGCIGVQADDEEAAVRPCVM